MSSSIASAGQNDVHLPNLVPSKGKNAESLTKASKIFDTMNEARKTFQPDPEQSNFSSLYFPL